MKRYEIVVPMKDGSRETLWVLASGVQVALRKVMRSFPQLAEVGNIERVVATGLSKDA